MYFALMVFIVDIVFVIIIFIIYPLFIKFISLFFDKNKINTKINSFYPKISIIICAKNEETVIEDKIRNVLLIQYPRDKIEFLFVSDGSTDKTISILERYKKFIKVIVFNKNVGKTVAQNEAVKKAKGEIIIFSDANSKINKNAITKIVNHFQNSKIAGVSGCLIYKSKKNNNLESKYNSFDTQIKIAESRLGILLGSYGSLYAIRKQYYVELPPYIISDLVEPVIQLINRKYNVLETEAVSVEELNQSMKNELYRKTRIILRSIIGFVYLVKNNLYKRPMLFLHTIFRKVLRWFFPLYMFLIIISLGLFFFYFNIYFFICYIIMVFCFILFSYFAYKFKSGNIIFKFFSYFYIINLSCIIAIIRFLKGDKIISWKPRQ